ncbi:MAG: nitronate monooxygenase [Nitrospirae bacterium]|nr:MAG: nitronate monooxygenase [Nitrospirota bacterium]
MGIKIKELKIGDLTARLPIIQGGMGVGISLAGLASAVANQGAIGVISASGIGLFEPDGATNYLEANIRALRKEIRKARELTKGILGLNILVASSNFDDMARTAVEEGIDIIFSGAGLPLNLPQFLTQGKKTKLVPIVSSARAARIIIKKWKEKYDYIPDALVVEGPMAGGHLGFKLEQINAPEYSLENLVAEVIKEVRIFEEKYKKPIPVIAAGGIYTGADMYKFLQMGAAGVQMATRFVTTFECDASPDFKQTYIDAGKDDIVIIKSPVGMPGRAIRNKFIDDVNKGERKPFKCPYHCIITCDYKNSPYCIALALMSAQKGNLKNGFAFAGENASRAEKIISVKELMKSLMEEYEEAVNKDKGNSRRKEKANY